MRRGRAHAPWQDLKLVCVLQDDVELVARMIDHVLKALPPGEGDVKVEVNPKDKTITGFWKQQGFSGVDAQLTRPRP